MAIEGHRVALESGIWVYHQRSKNQIVEQSSTSLLPSLEASWTQKAFLPAADVNYCLSQLKLRVFRCQPEEQLDAYLTTDEY